MNKTINLISQKYDLTKAIFTKLPKAKNNLNESYEVILDDIFSNFEMVNNDFSFDYCRKVSLRPESLFIIEVTFHYEAQIKEDDFISFKKWEDAKAFIEKKYRDIINNTTIPSWISQIVANLSSANGGQPLIIQPFLVDVKAQQKKEVNE